LAALRGYGWIAPLSTDGTGWRVLAEPRNLRLTAAARLINSAHKVTFMRNRAARSRQRIVSFLRA
jgi:hypothetical protein